jgi:hypothetical protein
MGQSFRDDYNRQMDDDGDAAAPPAPKDLLLVLPPTEPRSDAMTPAFYPVVRRRGERVEVGAIRELESGKPIHGEVVRLERRPEHPLLFEVETLAQVPAAAQPAPGRSGPAQVASEEYRANWEAIFGLADQDNDNDNDDNDDNEDNEDNEANDDHKDTLN